MFGESSCEVYVPVEVLPQWVQIAIVGSHGGQLAAYHILEQRFP